MKKISLLLFLVATTFQFSSCKSYANKYKNGTQIEKVPAAAFVVENAKNDINFTAYKTTEKVAVGGKFTRVDVISGGEGASVKEAIHNTEFSIPVTTLATKDSSRDYKIRKFFFGVMENTDLLKGKLLINDETTGTAKITMNGETKDVPFTYTIKDKIFNMKATIDVNDWNASAALAKLNEVCKLLHTGADGVSKTWSEVALDITSSF